MRLDGKVALITGAGMGMGREASILFSQEGAKIIAIDLDNSALNETVNLVKNNGGEIIGCIANVAVEAEVKEAVEKGYSHFKKLDIVYNNAGVLWRDRDKSVLETNEEIWDKVLAINLKGPYFVCKYCIPKLIKNEGGAIVNVGSISALVGFERAQDAYTSSKGALISFTKSLAVQYAKYNIRANIIHPGMIATPLQAEEMKNPEWVESVKAGIPLKRFGEPRDISYAALYLASDEASFVTGAEIVVDGGFMAT